MSSIDDLLNLKSDDISDIKSWINSVVSSDTSNKELKDLIMKLQFVSQDIEKSLDRLQDQLSQSMPSLKQVLSDISTESISLKEDFIRINRDVHTIQSRNESVIGNLSRVHSIEESMKLCVESLSEIHHWETRIRKVKKLFDEREFELISKELNLMKSRVAMLAKNMPNLYSTRNVMVEELIQKLQQMVLPFLNETFEKHDYRSYRYYSQILTTIDAFDEVKAQYILNRLDAMKQLLLHFSHKNAHQRIRSLNVWLNDLVLNVLRFFEDEWDWTQQIFHNKHESIAITTKLIANICDEMNIELKQWISVFLATDDDDDDDDAVVQMTKVIALFEIFCTFFGAVYDSRLLTHHYNNQKDVLQLMPNVTNLVSNVLSTTYSTNYVELEERLMFGIFGENSSIRWIHENKLNELSFIDLHERIEDSVAVLLETLRLSHERCLLISGGALMADMMALYDALIVEYIGHVDALLTRCCYDSSKMISPFAAAAEEDVVDLSAKHNWIVDLKQAFTLKQMIESAVEERIVHCVDEILSHFIRSIDELCNDELLQHKAAPVLFHRIFLSNSELKLLSKFSNAEESKNESLITHAIDERMESILLNIMMMEIKQCIQNIGSLVVWGETPSKSQQMLNLPQFNVQPNEYIKKIGSHLLALVQQLETHEAEEKEEEEESLDSEKWLNLVLNETVLALFMDLYKLNALSLKGSKQLITDLNYLCNVSNAIYLDQPEFIYAILAVLQCKLGNSNQVKERLTSDTDDDTNDKKTDPKLRTSFQRKVATKFAVLRGLNIRFV